MDQRKTVILMMFFFMMFSCQNKTTKQKKDEGTKTEIQYSLVSKGNLLGNGIEGIEAGSLWIRGEVEWNDLKQKMNIHNPVSESFIVSDIDFNQFDVIACFDIVRPHTGFIVRVEKIIEDANNRIVYISQRENNNGFAVPSQPFFLVKMEKSQKTVMFQ